MQKFIENLEGEQTFTATSPMAQQALLATDTFSFASNPCIAPQTQKSVHT